MCRSQVSGRQSSSSFPCIGVCFHCAQTAEKSNVFFGDVASNTVSGTAAIAGREDGAPASSVVASLPGALHSADDDADGDFTGALMGRATLAGAGHSAGACIACVENTLLFLLGLFERAVEDTLQFALDVGQAFLPAVLVCLA